MSWTPTRSLAETDALLIAPGSVHEMETALVDGRLFRVYKNLWPSLREFWLASVAQFSSETYIVYEDLRLTYDQVHRRALRTASMLQNVYGIKKGDRVGICSRNCPDYLVVFWACHLIGAVSVLANAWLPLDPLTHCLALTNCRVVIVDPERADVLQVATSRIIRQTDIEAFLVLELGNHQWQWDGMDSFQRVLDAYPSDGMDLMHSPVSISPEDNATILFTSGTTGLPKGVLSTQRQYLTNVLNILYAGMRATLRRGDDFPTQQKGGPQKGMLIAVPLFHVTGCTSFAMMATMTGMKIVLTRKWEIEEAVRLIKREGIAVAGGVPSMVTDLTLSSLVGHPLEGLLFGGCPAPDSLVARAREAFPTATMMQAYGMTEVNSIAVSFSGEDYLARPTSTGLPTPVNDIKIVHDNSVVAPYTVGEVWLRGPNVMSGYWGEPVATNAVLTKDGWLKTGDLGYLDKEGFLYIKDRLKDIIIRGGENIDSVSVENALYSDPRVLEAAAVGVPDDHLGELVATLVTLRPEYAGQVTESMLLDQCRGRLPRFAVPVMVLVLNKAFERTPSGKIMKNDLRKVAKRQWEMRKQKVAETQHRRERLANL